MPRPLVRKSMISEAVDLLRTSIRNGDFKEYLLPERQLCLEIGISRPTLRAALQQLEQEGVIEVNGRLGRKVLKIPEDKEKRTDSRVVRMLQNVGPASLLSRHLQTQEFLAEHLSQPGSEFHVETAPACFGKKPRNALEHLVRTRPSALWILYLTTEAIQTWFHEQQIPCLVLGSTYEGLNFVSLDEDYQATCRHAAGIFLARNHRRLALLFSRVKRPGDMASRIGFEEGVYKSKRSDVEYYLSEHDETVRGICKAVDWVLARPNPIQGWLVLNAQTYITVLSHLARRGVLVGKDVSVICRDSDPYFEAIVPPVAHYQRDMRRLNQNLFDLIEKSLRNLPITRRNWMVPSEFVDGDSLRKL